MDTIVGCLGDQRFYEGIEKVDILFTPRITKANSDIYLALYL